MSFKKVIDKFEEFDFDRYFENVRDKDIKNSIYKKKKRWIWPS